MAETAKLVQLNIFLTNRDVHQKNTLNNVKEKQPLIEKQVKNETKEKNSFARVLSLLPRLR
jgi:hypothetical protein